MNKFFNCLSSERLKFIYMRVTIIVTTLTVFLQSALAYIAAKQVLYVGLDATPETNGYLLEAIPGTEYLGFDVTVFGLLPMIVLGAIYGAYEYKAHGMRTSLICVNDRRLFFIAKLITVSVSAFLISLVSIVLTISVTHVSLGTAGLNPFTLAPTVWKYILLCSSSWTGLTVLSFAIGFLFKTAMVSLLFLVPQVYNVGNFLAERFAAARLLPVAAGNGLIASSAGALSTVPLKNIFILSVWIFVFGLAAYVRFVKSDLSGEY